MLRKLGLQIIPPIASLSKLSLASEKIIYATVSKHLQNILSSHFLVFRRSRSWTIPQLFFDESFGWIHCIEKPYAIYSDISTAYDQGDHSILFQNIQRLGLGVSLQKVVASSLRNRVQQVKSKRVIFLTSYRSPVESHKSQCLVKFSFLHSLTTSRSTVIATLVFLLMT